MNNHTRDIAQKDGADISVRPMSQRWHSVTGPLPKSKRRCVLGPVYGKEIDIGRLLASVARSGIRRDYFPRKHLRRNVSQREHLQYSTKSRTRIGPKNHHNLPSCPGWLSNSSRRWQHLVLYSDSPLPKFLTSSASLCFKVGDASHVSSTTFCDILRCAGDPDNANLFR